MTMLRFVLPIALLALTGCVTTKATMLGTASVQRPAVAPQDVAIYRFSSQVPSRYEEVALLNSTGDSNFTDEAAMFASMRKKAGQMGANGVILDNVNEPGHGAKVAAAIFGVSAQRRGQSVAIWVFKDEPAATTAAAATAAPSTLAPAPTGHPPATSAPATAAPCAACSQIGKGL